MIPYYACHFFPLILERERICMCERENKTEAVVQVYSYPYSLPMEGLTGFSSVLLYEMLIPKAYLLLTKYINGYHWFRLQKRDRHLCVWLIKMVFLPPFFIATLPSHQNVSYCESYLFKGAFQLNHVWFAN